MLKNTFRVIHVAEDMAKISGGIPEVVRQLSAGLSSKNISVQVAYAKGQPQGFPNAVETFCFPPHHLAQSWSWGQNLGNGMIGLAESSLGELPLFHVHGAWSAPQYIASRTANRLGLPLIFSAHGMLEPWLWSQQGWQMRVKKEIYWKIFAYPKLRKANIIHAITPIEKNNLARLFKNVDIEVIPNAIELGDNLQSRYAKREKSILFLGRLEPKKGVDLLLRAFGAACIGNGWSLDVVGPSWSNEYQEKLILIVKELGIGNQVKFHGPLFGEAKQALIDSAWVMATPSHSEVVGLVNLEAAARFLPSITTHQTGLDDWEMGGGLLVDPSVASIKKAIEAACSWGDREQFDRGLASRSLIENKYSWKVVLPKWVELYNSLL